MPCSDIVHYVATYLNIFSLSSSANYAHLWIYIKMYVWTIS
jgi:hypothetical protein